LRLLHKGEKGQITKHGFTKRGKKTSTSLRIANSRSIARNVGTGWIKSRDYTPRKRRYQRKKLIFFRRRGGKEKEVKGSAILKKQPHRSALKDITGV